MKASTQQSDALVFTLSLISALCFSIAILKPRKRKFLLIVDDLDRCPSSEIVSIVDSIRLLLEDDDLVNYMQTAVLVDDDRLKCAIADIYCEQIPLYNVKSKKIEETTLDLTKKIINIRSHIVEEQIQKLFIATLRLEKLSDYDVDIISHNVVEEFVGEKLSVAVESDKPLPDKSQTDKLQPNKPRTDKLQPDKTQPDKTQPDKSPLDKPQLDKPRRDKPQPSKFQVSKQPLTPGEGQLIIDFVKRIYNTKPDLITPRSIRFYLFKYMLARDLLEILNLEQDVDITVAMMEHLALGESEENIKNKSYFNSRTYNIIKQVF